MSPRWIYDKDQSTACTSYTAYTYSRGPPLRRWYDVREQYDRLIEESRITHSRLLVQLLSIPQKRQAISTALYRDTALLRPHYWGTATTVVDVTSMDTPEGPPSRINSMLLLDNRALMGTP